MASCDHKLLVVHRTEVESHNWKNDAEACCSCSPALLCPVCFFGVLSKDGFILAPDDTVEALRRMGMRSDSVH